MLKKAVIYVLIVAGTIASVFCLAGFFDAVSVQLGVFTPILWVTTSLTVIALSLVVIWKRVLTYQPA